MAFWDDEAVSKAAISSLLPDWGPQATYSLNVAGVTQELNLELVH